MDKFKYCLGPAYVLTVAWLPLRSRSLSLSPMDTLSPSHENFVGSSFHLLLSCLESFDEVVHFEGVHCSPSLRIFLVEIGYEVLKQAYRKFWESRRHVGPNLVMVVPPS